MDFVAHGLRGFQVAPALAGGAGFAQDVVEVFARTFAGELHQPQAGEAVEGNAGAVEAQGFGHFAQYGLAVLFAHHIDEIHNNHTAEVAQAQLAGDGVAGIEVGFEDGFVEIARAHEAAGVHVDGGHGFGALDNQVAAEV